MPKRQRARHTSDKLATHLQANHKFLKQMADYVQSDNTDAPFDALAKQQRQQRASLGRLKRGSDAQQFPVIGRLAGDALQLSRLRKLCEKVSQGDFEHVSDLVPLRRELSKLNKHFDKSPATAMPYQGQAQATLGAVLHKINSIQHHITGQRQAHVTAYTHGLERAVGALATGDTQALSNLHETMNMNWKFMKQNKVSLSSKQGKRLSSTTKTIQAAIGLQGEILEGKNTTINLKMLRALARTFDSGDATLDQSFKTACDTMAQQHLQSIDKSAIAKDIRQLVHGLPPLDAAGLSKALTQASKQQKLCIHLMEDGNASEKAQYQTQSQQYQIIADSIRFKQRLMKGKLPARQRAQLQGQYERIMSARPLKLPQLWQAWTDSINTQWRGQQVHLPYRSRANSIDAEDVSRLPHQGATILGTFVDSLDVLANTAPEALAATFNQTMAGLEIALSQLPRTADYAKLRAYCEGNLDLLGPIKDCLTGLQSAIGEINALQQDIDDYLGSAHQYNLGPKETLKKIKTLQHRIGDLKKEARALTKKTRSAVNTLEQQYEDKSLAKKLKAFLHHIDTQFDRQLDVAIGFNKPFDVIMSHVTRVENSVAPHYRAMAALAKPIQKLAKTMANDAGKWRSKLYSQAKGMVGELSSQVKAAQQKLDAVGTDLNSAENRMMTGTAKSLSALANTLDNLEIILDALENNKDINLDFAASTLQSRQQDAVVEEAGLNPFIDALLEHMDTLKQQKTNNDVPFSLRQAQDTPYGVLPSQPKPTKASIQAKRAQADTQYEGMPSHLDGASASPPPQSEPGSHQRKPKALKTPEQAAELEKQLGELLEEERRINVDAQAAEIMKLEAADDKTNMGAPDNAGSAEAEQQGRVEPKQLAEGKKKKPPRRQGDILRQAKEEGLAPDAPGSQNNIRKTLK